MKSKNRGQDFMRHATNVRVQINPSADPAYSRFVPQIFRRQTCGVSLITFEGFSSSNPRRGIE